MSLAVKKINTKGQAIAELSIMGSLLLIVIAATLGQWNYLRNQQDVEMEAFRRALFYAEKSGNHFNPHATSYPNHWRCNVSYNVTRDYPFFNLFNFGSYNLQRVSGAGSVIWAHGVKSTNYNYIQVNDDYPPLDLGDDAAEKRTIWSGTGYHDPYGDDEPGEDGGD